MEANIASLVTCPHSCMHKQVHIRWLVMVCMVSLFIKHRIMLLWGAKNRKNWKEMKITYLCKMQSIWRTESPLPKKNQVPVWTKILAPRNLTAWTLPYSTVYAMAAKEENPLHNIPATQIWFKMLTVLNTVRGRRIFAVRREVRWYLEARPCL